MLKQHGRLIAINDGSATVGVPPKLVKLAQSKSAEVENAFGKVCQRKIKVSFQPNQSQNQTAGETVISSPAQSSPSPTKSPSPISNNQIASSADSSFTNTQQLVPSARQNNPIQNQPAIAKTAFEGVPPPQNQQNSIAKPVESDPEAEQVMSSAKRLAEFFDGAIVSFVDEPEEFGDSSSVLEIEEDDL